MNKRLKLTASCTANGVITEGSIDVSELTRRLESSLSSKLARRGIDVVWCTSLHPELQIQFVRIAKGNQFLRYLIPFLAPASVEIKGAYPAADTASATFHHTERASIGIFGGSTRHMLGVCVDRLAIQLANNISRAHAPPA